MFDEYVDRCLMECAILNLAWIYEEEEQQLLLRETQNKVERDQVKQKTDMAKMGLREVEEAIAKGGHPHFRETPGEYSLLDGRDTMAMTPNNGQTTMMPNPSSPDWYVREPENSIRNKQLDQSSRLN